MLEYKCWVKDERSTGTAGFVPGCSSLNPGEKERSGFFTKSGSPEKVRRIRRVFGENDWGFFAVTIFVQNPNSAVWCRSLSSK